MLNPTARMMLGSPLWGREGLPHVRLYENPIDPLHQCPRLQPAPDTPSRTERDTRHYETGRDANGRGRYHQAGRRAVARHHQAGGDADRGGGHDPAGRHPDRGRRYDQAGGRRCRRYHAQSGITHDRHHPASGNDDRRGYHCGNIDGSRQGDPAVKAADAWPGDGKHSAPSLGAKGTAYPRDAPARDGNRGDESPSVISGLRRCLSRPRSTWENRSRRLP